MVFQNTDIDIPNIPFNKSKCNFSTSNYFFKLDLYIYRYIPVNQCGYECEFVIIFVLYLKF